MGGKPSSPHWRYHAHNLKSISYQGSPHLTYCEIQLDAARLNIGANIIMNDRYEIVAQFPKTDGLTELDPHEFQIIGNGTKFIQVGRIRRRSDWLFAENGTIGESVVQVVDITTRKVEFEWRSLSRVPLDESCLFYPNLDYFHANSVVKDSDGNYLIIGYHTCTLYKISGASGAVMWRLGGRKSNFTMLGGYDLIRMHHVRIQDLNSVKVPVALQGQVSDKTHLALSIFDNAIVSISSPTPSAESSAAVIVLLDLVAMTAQIIERYVQPEGMFAALFGSVQSLPNGDRFIGWGGQRGISQYTQSNELVYHAEIADAAMPTYSYRAFKGPWTGHPKTKPDMFSYSWACTWNSTMYASWNGATEVKYWRFFGGASATDPFAIAAVVTKDGFETRARASFFARYAYVEALQADGSMLGRSRIVTTHVCRPEYTDRCSELRCHQNINWTEAQNMQNCGSETSNVSGDALDQSVLAL